MRRVWKWTKRIAIGTVAVVGLAIGVVLMIAHTDWGRDFIRRRAESALLENFPGGVRIGRITGSVFGTLVVEDVVINNRDGKPWITVGTAKVKLSLLPLVRKIARIDAVEIDDVVVDQHPQPKAPEETPAPPGEPSPWTIEIPEVAVHRGRVAIVTATRTFDVQHVEATASLSVGDGAFMIVTGLDGSWQGKPIHASAALRFADGHINAPYMQATMEGADVLAFGAQLKPKLAGIVRAQLPAATMKAVAGVKLPGDAAAVVSANENKLDATVTMANATARALVVVDVTAVSAEGLIVAQVPDGARLDPRFAGAGIVTASFDANLEHARGIVTLDGVRPVDPATVGVANIRGKTLVAIDGTLAGAWVYLEGALDIGGARVTGFATASRDKTTGAITLQKSTLVATARKVGAPKTDLSVGYIAANARATGEVWPKQTLKISGSAGGENVRYTTYSSETVDVRFDLAKQLAGHLDATSVYKGARLLGSASLDAHGSQTGDVTSIDVDSHSITTAANGVWSGNGGHIEISPLKVLVQHLHTGNGGGTATADVTFARDTKDLTATVDAKQVVLATVAPDMKGTVGGHVVVARTNGRWNGNGHLVATQLAAPKQPGMAKLPASDVDATFEVSGRRVIAHVKTTADAGVVALGADVEGPADLTDVSAWRRLDRRALRDAKVEVAHLDTTKLGFAKLTGTVAGTLDLTATQASGTLHVQGVQTSRGAIAADLTLKPGPTSVTAELSARFADLGGGTVTADLAFPDHIFDPDAWQAKGKHVLAHAHVAVPSVAVDPSLLAKLNVTAPYSGRVEASADIAEGAATASATIDVHGAQGGAIKQPIDVHVDAGIDALAHATLTATSGAVTLAVVDVHVPFDLDHVTDVRTAKLDGTVTFPKASAKDLIAIFGRGDATAGTVDGSVTIAGTVDAPTADGKLTAENVTIKPTIAGRASQKLAKLVIKGGWTGTAGHLDITGNETSVTKGVPDGMLHITAQGRPDQLAALTASVESANFDIAPFTAFFSGAVGAARGTLNASLNLKGFDPNTGDLHGTLQLRNGRFPLSALLGTLRSIDADITVDNHDVKLTNLDAKLGKGTLHGTGHLALVGSTPSKAHVDLAIKQVSLVRAFQPTIDAQVAGDFTAGAQWTGDVTVSRGHVTIATTGGVKLLDASVPNDIIFIDVAQSAIRPLSQRPPPSRPWLIADVTIKPTALDVIQDEFQVRGDASGKITVSLGQDSIGVDGSIEAERGDIDLLGARSLLDHANVVFDGSIDPLLDVRVIRDLDSLTITADITGRASAWELHMSSDSGSYTQSELYSFFVGGQPASSRGDAGQAAAAAGAGVASALITKKLNKLFGTNLAFNYETATATSSDAIRIGYWYNRRTFIAARAHYEARIDENAEEGFVEYHFKSNWLLQINAGDRNYDGLDFVHRWHW